MPLPATQKAFPLWEGFLFAAPPPAQEATPFPLLVPYCLSFSSVI